MKLKEEVRDRDQSGGGGGGGRGVEGGGKHCRDKKRRLINITQR